MNAIVQIEKLIGK